MRIAIAKIGLMLIGTVFILSYLPEPGATESKIGQNEKQVFLDFLDNATTSLADKSAIELSQIQLNALKNGTSYEKAYARLAVIDQDELRNELNTDEKRLAFWVNIYNANIIITLSNNPKLYDNRGDFFKKDRVVIAGQNLSFDKIEHGIIRNSTLKLSKGYIKNPFPGSFEKDFRVDEKDPRIHFVLNCGAKDCPPVHVYAPETVDEDFDAVAKAYLTKVSKYDTDKNRVETTPLFQWFTGDWGGNSGVKDMLAQYKVIPKNHKGIDVDYLGYDWTLDIDNFGKALDRSSAYVR